MHSDIFLKKERNRKTYIFYLPAIIITDNCVSDAHTMQISNNCIKPFFMEIIDN